MNRWNGTFRRCVSVIVLIAMTSIIFLPTSVKADAPEGYTDVTQEMCTALNNNIAQLAEDFAFDEDTSQKLSLYRTTYDNYILWDSMAERSTTVDTVSNITRLATMEEAYSLLSLLKLSYPLIAPFEANGISSYFDVSDDDYNELLSYSSDSSSDISKFVSGYSEPSEDLCSFMYKDEAQVCEGRDNEELARTVSAVYLFVNNNQMVFKGVLSVRGLLQAAPETTDITKATYDSVVPAVETVGIEKTRFETSATVAQRNAFNSRVEQMTNGIYTTIDALYQDYILRCKEIAFERKIDDLYETIYSTMDVSTLAEDDQAIKSMEDAYNCLEPEVQKCIVNYNMLQALRNKYNDNLEYYNTVIVPANHVSSIIESDFWKLFEMNWPQCADAAQYDSKTVETGILSADTIIQHSISAYNGLTTAQKQKVTTVSYMDYMKKTYASMNVKYMTEKAKLFYSVLSSNDLLQYEDDINRAYRWMKQNLTEDVITTLNSTLVDNKNAESDVLTVIQSAATNLANLQANMGSLTEEAIRDLVLLTHNAIGKLTIDDIENVYDKYQDALANTEASKKLTDNSKYEIEALHGLALLAENANKAVEACNEVDLTKEENKATFKQLYSEAEAAVEAYEEEYKQVQKDFETLADGSDVCLVSSLNSLFLMADDYQLLMNWNNIISTYDKLGTIEALNDETIQQIEKAFASYLTVVGEDTTVDFVYAGALLREWNNHAQNVKPLNQMINCITETPSTETEIAEVNQAKDYYDSLSELEKSLVEDTLVNKLSAALSVHERVENVISCIESITEPKDDASYLQFTASLDIAQDLYDKFINDYKSQSSWITNASKLSQYTDVRNEIEQIKELLKAPTTQMCDNLADIKTAIAVYEDMSTTSQNMVFNSSLLYRLYQDVSQAEALRAKLKNLIVLTLSDETTVDDARKQYDSLSDAAKQYVTNYINLTMAEKQLVALKDNAARASQSSTSATQTSAVESSKTSANESSTAASKKSIKKGKVTGIKKKYKLSSKKKLNTTIKSIKKKLVLKLSGKKLVKKKDYKVQIKTLKNKKKLVMTLTGKGNFTGKKKVLIQIVYSKKV